MYYTVHIFVLLEKFKQNPVKCPLAPLAHEPRPLYRATILKFPGTICVDHNAKTLEASKMSSLLKWIKVHSYMKSMFGQYVCENACVLTLNEKGKRQTWKSIMILTEKWCRVSVGGNTAERAPSGQFSSPPRVHMVWEDQYNEPFESLVLFQQW